MGQKPDDNRTPSTNSNLEDEVDKLLDEVEALTKEVLCESPANAEVPQVDPQGQVAEDDAGIASESPLIQDGERTSIDDIVADVDLELDRATRKLDQVLDPPTGEAAPEDTLEPPAVPPKALEPDLEALAELQDLERELGADLPDTTDPAPEQPPDTAGTDGAATGTPDPTTQENESIVDDLEDLTRSVSDLSGEVMSHADSAAAAPEAAPPPTAQPPKPPDELASDVESELDQLENLLSELEGKPAPEPPAPTPAIEAEAVAPHTQPSAEEVALDADLEALLAAPPNKQAGGQDGEAAASGVDLDNISIWELIRERTTQRLREAGDTLRRGGQGRLLWFLDLLDRPFGRISPRHKELIGYCAIATVAMSGVALFLAVLV